MVKRKREVRFVSGTFSLFFFVCGKISSFRKKTRSLQLNEMEILLFVYVFKLSYYFHPWNGLAFYYTFLRAQHTAAAKKWNWTERIRRRDLRHALFWRGETFNDDESLRCRMSLISLRSLSYCSSAEKHELVTIKVWKIVLVLFLNFLDFLSLSECVSFGADFSRELPCVKVERQQKFSKTESLVRNLVAFCNRWSSQ